MFDVQTSFRPVCQSTHFLNWFDEPEHFLSFSCLFAMPSNFCDGIGDEANESMTVGGPGGAWTRARRVNAVTMITTCSCHDFSH